MLDSPFPYFNLRGNSVSMSGRNIKMTSDVFYQNSRLPHLPGFCDLNLSNPVFPSPNLTVSPWSNSDMISRIIGMLHIPTGCDYFKVFNPIILLIKILMVNLHIFRNNAISVSPNQSMSHYRAQSAIDLNGKSQISFATYIFSSPRINREPFFINGCYFSSPNISILINLEAPNTYES